MNEKKLVIISLFSLMILLSVTLVSAVDCLDNDANDTFPNGRNPYEKGILTYRGSSFPEKCNSKDTKVVDEFFCDASAFKVAAIDCSKLNSAMFCHDGACVLEIPVTEGEGEVTAVENQICCYSYGIGVEGVHVNEEYEIILESDCAVAEDFVGGGKEIVADSLCDGCPTFSLPYDGWCEEGIIVPSLKDENGCYGPPECADDVLPCTSEYTDCSLDPATCPSDGQQNEVCVDSCGGSNRITLVTCTPGECTGCISGGDCLPLGFRVASGGSDSYCAVGGSLLVQKADAGSCQNNFECKSNQCSNGECVDVLGEVRAQASLLRKIWCYITNPFDSNGREDCIAGN